MHRRVDAGMDAIVHALPPGSGGTVQISNEYLDITFRSEAISINENSLGFALNTKLLKIEPKPSTEFSIKIGDTVYKALYAGGFFTFPRSEYSLLSFLRVHDK